MTRVNKLYYFANYFPDSKARHVQIAKMVDAFTGCMEEVEFVLRDYRRDYTQDIEEYFNLENSLNTVEIASIKFLPLKYDYFYHSNLKKYLNRIVGLSGDKKPVLYSRYGKNSGRLAELLVENGKCSVFIEVHEGVTPRELNYLKQLSGIVVISNALKLHLIDSGISENNIVVAQSSADLDTYINNAKSKNELREMLSLPKDKSIVLYSGHLYKDRGIEGLIESVSYLDEDIKLVIVGGLEQDINRVKGIVSNKGLNSQVILVGKKPASSIPHYQMSADVLVMPYSTKWELQEWSSPMKMFEYMASKTPIVASDFPTVREMLDEGNSVPVKPDDPQQLAEGIKRCLNEKSFSASISEKAFEDVKQFTWKNRAKKILEFIESRT